MGELIEKLAEVNINGQEFDIELNSSTFSQNKREIHIQNESFRLAVPEDEFLEMVACVLLAKKQLMTIKGYGESDNEVH